MHKTNEDSFQELYFLLSFENTWKYPNMFFGTWFQALKPDSG